MGSVSSEGLRADGVTEVGACERQESRGRTGSQNKNSRRGPMITTSISY